MRMAFQKYSKYAVLILITIVFVLLTAGSASAYEGCRNGTDVEHNYTDVAYGEWNISNGTITCSNILINVSGNITVNNGSTFILSNVTLAFNDSSSGASNKSWINVSNGSAFQVLSSSNITVASEAFANHTYSIMLQNGSTTYINNSVIEYTSNETNANEYGFLANGFLEIYTSDIQKGIGYALRVNGTDWTGSTGSFKMTYTNISSTRRGLLIYNTSILGTLLNNNFSSITENFELESNYTKLSLQNTTVNLTKTFSSTADYTNISWPVSFRVRNSHGNSDGTLLLSSVAVNATSSANTSYANTSLTTDSNGLTTATYFFSSKKNNVTIYTYGNYSVNVTSSLGNFSDNLTAGYYYNITSAQDGLLAINVTVYEQFNNVSLAKEATSAEISAGSFANITMVINNTGNGGDPQNWSVFTLSSNASGLSLGGWSISFTNNSINLTNSSSQTVKARINIPSTAKPNETYIFNITANVTGPSPRGGTSRIDSFQFTLQVNNSTNGIDYGLSVQNATNWLNINLSSEDGEWGAWNRSNYTTAWGLWAYAPIYEVNTSLIYNVTSWLNFTQDATGYWTDTKYDNNVTTALITLAYKNNDYADAPGAANNYTNITGAVNYLQLQGSFDDASYNCWPNSSCDAYNTSVILSALMKATTTNTNLTKNATDWLTDNQSSDGSWNNNLTHTSWAVYALGSANSTYTGIAPNLSNGANWIQNQQQIEGYFGDSGNIFDTAIAVIALQEGGNASWTVDVDQNTTTTNDQYAGSIKLALDWILTQQESNGGWGVSPANALGSGLGVLVTGNYTTLSGTITGAGYAPGFILENTTVTIGTYNTTVNNIGEYVLNVPASTYNLFTNHTEFETNNTNTSVSMSSGSNKTQDLTMLPTLELVGDNYGAGNFFSILATSWSNGATYAINGTARYTYNKSQIVPANFTLSSNPGHAGFTISATAFNRSFGISSKTSPAPSSTTSYAATITVTDDYGTSATTSRTISVVGGGSDDSVSPISGGSDVPSSTGPEYSLSVTSYDSKVSVIQGEFATTSFTIKNNGKKKLEDVKIEVIGVPNTWYTALVSSTGLSSEDLSTGESVTFDIKFTPPADAEPKSYTITIKAKDKDGQAIAEKKVTFKVTKVWDTTKIAQLKDDIEAVKKDLSGAEGEVTVLKAKGVDITSIESDITAFSTAIQNAIAKYNAGEYTDSEKYFKEAQDLLEKINKAIAAAKPPEKRIGKLLEGISLGIISIVIIVILVGGFVGFILWYKLFRVIPVSEVKKDPDLFVEGARIEGVVKSITETKKGKVFLIQDHTEKLHVRYPYYTTIEEGNLIRAVGSIKTYKDVPYMDASDIHRVTVKHFGSFKKSGRLHQPASNFLKRFVVKKK